jgi:hypothetical protein
MLLLKRLGIGDGTRDEESKEGESGKRDDIRGFLWPG